MHWIIRWLIDLSLFLRYIFWKTILTSWGGALEPGTKIHEQVRFIGTPNNPIRIGREVCLMRGALLSAAKAGSIEIGYGSYIGEYCVIMSQGKIAIGKKVMFAPHCVIADYAHRSEDVNRPMIDQGTQAQEVVIGDDVWLGAGTNILKGVRIGEGSIIGAGSVVTRDIPAYSVAVGSPARVIRSRK